MISKRAQIGIEIPSQSSYLNKLYNNDPFDEKTNEMGYIRLSCADNSLSSDLIFEKFRSINWKKFDEDKLLHYPRDGGELSTLTSAANFINKFSRKGLNPLSPNDLVIVSGVTMASDILSQVLFDSEDIVLTPAPYYYRFVNDFGERGLVFVEAVQTLTENGLEQQFLVKQFEEAYLKSKKGKVRAILIVNPKNPDGCYFTLDQLKPLIDWALEKNLFILLDEVYDLSIYDEQIDCPFQSAIQLFKTPYQMDRMIWLWSMSKVFSIPGIRAGVLYTTNKQIKETFTRFMMFHQPNCVTQFIMRHFLDDKDWFEQIYLPENLCRLKSARDRIISFLESQGIPYVRPRAGFYILADFSKFMDEQSIEGERRLCERFIRKKVLINSGEEIKAPKPGWFRIVFSSISPSTLEKSFQRIIESLAETN